MMKIGCLGAAAIAPKALVEPARARQDVVLQAVAARDPERARDFADQHGFAEALKTYDDVVRHPEIDLVYNPLPAHLHAEWTIKALQAGKHVLCEKPFAMNAAEAGNVIAAAAQSGRRVVEAIHTRYHPAFETLIGWIQSGDIGPVRHIDAMFTAHIPETGVGLIRHLPETGGGAFMDLGCYPLHWALTVLGEPPAAITAEAELTHRGVDELLTAHLRFPDGVTARLHTSMKAGAPRQAMLTIEGEHGRIVYENPLNPQDEGRLSLLKGGERQLAPLDPRTTYWHQLDAVLGGLRTGEPLPTEGDATLIQQRTLDAVYAAAGLQNLRHSASAASD